MLLRRPAVLPLISVVLMFALTGAGEAAPKTDVVEFDNGDRITGEVKLLERGKLRLKTDHAGTMDIEWAHIAFVVSDQNIQLNTVEGYRYFGHLVRADSQHNVVVETSSGPIVIESKRVAGLAPIDEPGFAGIDLDVSAGYNFTKAGEVEQITLAFDAEYRTQKRLLKSSGSTIITDSKDAESSQRQTLNFMYTRLRENRWLNSGILNFSRNDELGLDLRTSIGASGGRIVHQTNNASVVLQGGLVVSRENISGEPEEVDSLEATFTFDWDWFRYDTPELDWSTYMAVIPSLTESGRVRGEWDMSLKWEIIDDLFIGFDIYNTFDSDPPAEDAEKHDYGINSSLTYKF